jgi:hypothetical protein
MVGGVARPVKRFTKLVPARRYRCEVLSSLEAGMTPVAIAIMGALVGAAAGAAMTIAYNELNQSSASRKDYDALLNTCKAIRRIRPDRMTVSNEGGDSGWQSTCEGIYAFWLEDGNLGALQFVHNTFAANQIWGCNATKRGDGNYAFENWVEVDVKEFRQRLAAKFGIVAAGGDPNAEEAYA